MAGPTFTETFSGSVVYPAQATYTALNLTANAQLQWPTELQVPGNPIVSNIIDVIATAGLAIQFADARAASQGYTALFNNVGANTFSVEDASGNVLMTVASGTAWVIYLTDNSTLNGAWRIFQLGAGTSTANAAALAGAGLVALTTTLNANIVAQAKNGNYAAAVGDRATALEWTGGTGTLTLPNTVPAGWFVLAKNNGTGVWTVSVSGGATIDGASTLALSPENSCFLIYDGANYFTVGLGQQLNSVFDFIQIDLTGKTGDQVLLGAQLNRISYRFTGIPTGNINIIVPNTVQQYWVDNETTGAFSLTVKTATGTGFVVGQTAHQILYCDGTNVVSAVTVTINLPVSIAQGGTGQTTAPAALTALGGAPLTETISAGAGLTGGGDLSAPRTFALNFKGAMVSNSGAQTPPTGGAALAWNQETTDIGGWHDNVTNNSRLTIPSGVTVVALTAQIQWRAGALAVDNWLINLSLRKNGATIVASTSDSHPSQGTSISFDIWTTVLNTGPIAVVAGDYFEVIVGGSGLAASTTGVQVDTPSTFQARSLT